MLNIEETFVAAMQPLNVRRPAEIDPACAEGSNADLVFVNDNAIVEIKCLTEDPQSAPDYPHKLGELYDRWFREGKVPLMYGTMEVNTASLPLECALELMLYVNGPTKRHVSKANDQIKKTKDALGMTDAKGLLVLCNTGNRSLRPDILLHGLDRMLGKHHRSIDWVIYMTHGLPVRLPGAPCPTEVFANIQRKDGRAMPRELFLRMYDAWSTHLSQSRGPIQMIHGIASSQLFGVEHD